MIVTVERVKQVNIKTKEGRATLNRIKHAMDPAVLETVPKGLDDKALIEAYLVAHKEKLGRDFTIEGKI